MNIPEFSLKLGNKNIAKYLGTEIDSKLNCQAQYNTIIHKLSAKKTTFSKIRYLLTTDFVISIYKACIKPALFDYNDFYYMLLSQKLQSMQRKLLRRVFTGSDHTSNFMLEKVGVEKQKKQEGKFIWQVLCIKEPKSLNILIIDSFLLGNLPKYIKKILKIPEVDLTNTFKSPIYMGSTLWNAIPRDIQVSDAYKKFK